MAGRKPLFPPVFSPTVSHPLVDDFSLRAARLQSRQAPAVPINASIPIRSNAMWSGNPELGIETAYQPDGNGIQTILKMGEWGPPAVWTISLGIAYDINQIPTPFGGDGQFAVDALIRYGSGGVTQEIEVDWAEGTVVVVPMNAVNILARYSDLSLGGRSNTPPDLRLRVNLAIGDGPQGFATKTTKIVVNGGGIPDARVVVIPKFARRLHVQRGEGSTGGAWDANMVYSFRGNLVTGDGGGFSGAEYLTNFGGTGIPIPAMTRAVRITNTTGSGESILLIFELAA